jgi:NDP-sugar pyrophosphorylase family protein
MVQGGETDSRMKAFLLAAGIGSRLGDLTKTTPKCLLPIGGRPLLDYWFDSLERAGVDEALINLHYLPELVKSYLAGRPAGIRVRTFFEPELLGSAGTLRSAWDFVEHEDSFFIAYADNFSQVDLTRLHRFHEQKGNPPLTLVAYPTDEPQRCGILELDPDGLVISFEEKPRYPRSPFANAGIHVASRDLYSVLPEILPADLGFHVLPKLVGRMYGYVTDEFIQDIGTPQTNGRVQELFSRVVK